MAGRVCRKMSALWRIEQKTRDAVSPVLNAILERNQKQIQRGIDLVERTGRHRIGVLGLSFKPHTDDVRESPAISLIETLVGRGYQVSVYDHVVEPAKLIGANRAFLERELPHIASLMRSSLEAVVKDAESRSDRQRKHSLSSGDPFDTRGIKS